MRERSYRPAVMRERLHRPVVRSILLLGLLPGLLWSMTGCGVMPQSQETGSSAVISVLGFQPEGTQWTLYAASEGQQGEVPFLAQSQGETPAAAVEALTNHGTRPVSCAHVEHLVLSQDGTGRLDDLLSYAFQDTRQSTEAQLWLLRRTALSQTFAEGKDPAAQLSVLKLAGKDKQGVLPLTLREAAAASAAGEAFFIPALEQQETGLHFLGYALYQDGEILAWFTGEAALGASLLQGGPLCWTACVEERAYTLRREGLLVKPVWEDGHLVGLVLACPLDGLRTGGWQSAPGDEAALVQQTARAMDTALHLMKRAGVDAAGLKQKTGLAAPLSWQRIARQWDAAFPTLQVSFSVPLTMAERH